MIQTTHSEEEMNALIQQALQQNRVPQEMDMNPEEAGKGLVQLALTLVNLLREVMEKQAMRRMDKGNLSEEQVERMGTTFMLLEEQMDHLKDTFDLSDEDLQLTLGNIEDMG